MTTPRSCSSRCFHGGAGRSSPSPPPSWRSSCSAAYLTGHSKKKASSFETTFVVPMSGHNSVAFLRVAARDSAGNSPMELEVNNLPTQKKKTDYYELWLTRDGKAIAPCGSFRVNQRNTTVRLSVPYDFKRFEGWVVTKQTAAHPAPGPVVMST